MIQRHLLFFLAAGHLAGSFLAAAEGGDFLVAAAGFFWVVALLLVSSGDGTELGQYSFSICHLCFAFVLDLYCV